MKCPRCGNENNNGTMYCAHCGTQLVNAQPTAQPVNNQNAWFNAPDTATPVVAAPMTFHVIYSIILLVVAGFSALGAIGFLFIEDGFWYTLASILPVIYMAATGILLLMRTKVGNVLRLILNILTIVRFSFSLLIIILGAIVMAIAGVGMLAAELAETGVVLTVVFVILGLYALVCIAGIVINALIMKYYRKRKHMFR